MDGDFPNWQTAWVECVFFLLLARCVRLRYKTERTYIYIYIYDVCIYGLIDYRVRALTCSFLGFDRNRVPTNIIGPKSQRQQESTNNENSSQSAMNCTSTMNGRNGKKDVATRLYLAVEPPTVARCMCVVLCCVVDVCALSNTTNTHKQIHSCANNVSMVVGVCVCWMCMQRRWRRRQRRRIYR